MGSAVRERSKDKPPKLPPRDSIYGPQNIPKPDYEQQLMDETRFRQQLEERNKKSKKNERKHDDPYYCGLRARIPNFAKSKAQRDRESTRMASQQHPQQPQQNSQQPQQPPLNPGVHHPMAAWHHGGRVGPVPHPGNMTNAFNFRNRPFERNPTTWVPSAPMRNAVSEWESYWQNEN